METSSKPSTREQLIAERNSMAAQYLVAIAALGDLFDAINTGKDIEMNMDKARRVLKRE
jgi:hypothetical protein